VNLPLACAQLTHSGLWYDWDMITWLNVQGAVSPVECKFLFEFVVQRIVLMNLPGFESFCPGRC